MTDDTVGKKKDETGNKTRARTENQIHIPYTENILLDFILSDVKVLSVGWYRYGEVGSFP